jgi:hypothetical protein
MLRTSNGSANSHHGLDRLRDYSIASPVPLLARMRSPAMSALSPLLRD